eukprot:SAG11_NODE_2383_length_3424_cov_1.725714_2_plen_220_part_00
MGHAFSSQAATAVQLRPSVDTMPTGLPWSIRPTFARLPTLLKLCLQSRRFLRFADLVGRRPVNQSIRQSLRKSASHANKCCTPLHEHTRESTVPRCMGMRGSDLKSYLLADGDARSLDRSPEMGGEPAARAVVGMVTTRVVESSAVVKAHVARFVLNQNPGRAVDVHLQRPADRVEVARIEVLDDPLLVRAPGHGGRRGRGSATPSVCDRGDSAAAARS